jgi:outer membrane protein TolC
VSRPDGVRRQVRRAGCEVRRATCRVALTAIAFFVASQCIRPAIVVAQAPTPSERVTFEEAIRRAVEKNPTVVAAATGILRAEGLIRQARAATRPQIGGTVTTTTLNTGVEFQGSVVTPQNQITASLTADMPIVAAAAWARRAQAEDTKAVSQLALADARRQIAFATADAYLTIIASRRVVESTTRSRDVAKVHFDYATELEQKGSGSRLNALRAQQQFSIDEGLVEVARLSLYRAQEALGVLIVADGPVDALNEPAFDLPPDTTGSLTAFRTDLKLFAGQEQAAEHVFRDSSKDWWPSLDAIFQPSTTYPSQFFLPSNSWRLLLQANVPIFDSGQRAGAKLLRQADVEERRATLAGGMARANSEVRAAREAIASAERSLVSARASADQAQQVVQITNVSFRAGAATNIEVIDAERTARDADFLVTQAEDSLRRARLELLTALGRFP